MKYKTQSITSCELNLRGISKAVEQTQGRETSREALREQAPRGSRVQGFGGRGQGGQEPGGLGQGARVAKTQGARRPRQQGKGPMGPGWPNIRGSGGQGARVTNSQGVWGPGQKSKGPLVDQGGREIRSQGERVHGTRGQGPGARGQGPRDPGTRRPRGQEARKSGTRGLPLQFQTIDRLVPYLVNLSL